MGGSSRSYVVPGDNDVLCGRGRLFYEHIGNTKFRDIIEAALPGYAKSDTKGEKTCFVRRVVNQISTKGGRFLKLDKSVNQWYQGDMVCAKSKVGHAFRDAIAEQTSGASSVDSYDGCSDSQKTGSGSEESQESEASLGASSLLLLGKAATEAKATTRGSAEASKKKRKEHDRLEATPKPPTAAASSQSIKKKPTAQPEAKTKAKGKPDSVESSSHRGRRKLGNLATVKQAMLKTLLLRQQALSRNNSFRKKPTETLSSSSARTDVESSSADSSNSSRASELLRQTSSAATSREDAIKKSDEQPTRGEPSDDHKKTFLKPAPMPTTSASSVKTSSRPSSSRSTNSSGLQPQHRGMILSTSAQKRVPGMLDAVEIKKAMLKTLALRQQALEKKGQQHDGRARVSDLLQKAKSARSMSASEILQQAMAAQNNAMGTSDLLKRALVVQQNDSVRSAGVASKGSSKLQVAERPRKQHKMAHQGSSRRTKPPPPPLVSPEVGSKPKYAVPASMKRRRQSHPPPTHETKSKKQRPLSDLARENSVLCQASIGPCYPSAMGVSKEVISYYFL